MTIAADLPMLDRKAQADAHFRRKRVVAFAVPAAIFVYFIYVFFAFDIPALAGKARRDNRGTLVSDAYSYKTHVTRDNR